ncbi:MAG: C40 family peptidase [Marmoricola sp.]
MPLNVCIRNLVLLPLLTISMLAGVTTFGPASSASATSRSHRVSRAVHVALQQVGDPYRYGAAGPRAFDCSGLMQYSFRRAGIKIPRTSSAQARRAHHISKSRLRRGDLMFFTDGGGVYHAAMFLGRSRGHARMLHSPGTGRRVRVDRPWTTRWFGATLRH